MDINKLSEILKQTNTFFKSKATSAVNTSLTLRNWLFGFYIVEYEQKGEDRAKYGDSLLEEISKKTNKTITGLSVSHLRIYRQFYKIYPEIANIALGFFPDNNPSGNRQTLSDDFKKNNILPFHQTLPDELELLPHKIKELSISPQRIVKSLSFSHLTELIKIPDPLKRTFYEIETINGTWSVRELKRQIATLYYERSGLSRDKEKLHALVDQKTEKLQVSDILKNPFAFEFLGFRNREIIEETDLEQALIDNLQQFLLELGNGFCFEARQKRILIGDEYYYIDLVFYHRILRCHILVDLKADDFSYEYAGQINTYVNYYKKEIKQKADRNPVGILLCTGSNEALVEYATAGMNKNLFINEYMVKLPSEQELKDFITQKLRELK